MPSNRTLDISVTFNCVHQPNGDFGGSASYAQTACDPSDMGMLVDDNGNIRLDEAAAFDPTQYNDSVDIILTLATPAQVSPDNTTTQVVWASVHGTGATIIVPQGGNASEFEVVATSPNVLTIVDNDDDSNTYNYKPAVELPAYSNYYISLDPVIVNKPKK